VEAQYGQLSLSERLVRGLGPVSVPTLGGLMTGSKLLVCRTVGAQLIGRQFLRPAMPLYQLAQELQRGLPVLVLRVKGLQHLAS
jgi:hypothetical protein